MFAEEQILSAKCALKISLANIVHVHAPSFEILSRLPFGRAKAAMHQQFDQRTPGSGELLPGNFLRGYFTNDRIEGRFGNARKFASEQNITGAQSLLHYSLAVH